MKRQPTEWKKIFENKTTNKRLILKTYKLLIQLYIKKTNNTIQKKKKTKKKQVGISKWTFLQRRQTDGTKTHEKDATNHKLLEKCKSKLQ